MMSLFAVPGVKENVTIFFLLLGVLAIVRIRSGSEDDKSIDVDVDLVVKLDLL